MHAQYYVFDLHVFKGDQRCLVSQVSGLGKNFNLGLFTYTINMINIKLCMMVLLIEFNLFISLSVTLTIFQGHRNVELKMLCSYSNKLKLVGL